MERNLTNLFTETCDVLARHKHTLDNIEHVTLFGDGIKLDEFFQFAEGFDYDPSYGHEWVPPFVLTMDDGTWYERAEYDGSEWWRFVSAPKAPTAHLSILSALVGHNRDWLYREASAKAEELQFSELLTDLDARYEEEMREERMDAYSDEFEGVLDAPVVSSKKNWHDGKGKCAYKSRCIRKIWDESCYGMHIRWATKHNSKCWKDQRGKGRKRRDTQYRMRG